MFVFLLIVTTCILVVVVATTIGLLVHKIYAIARDRILQRRQEQYGTEFHPLLLEELPTQYFETDRDIYLEQVRYLFEPLRDSFQHSSILSRRIGRMALRKMMLDLARDVDGETMYRLCFAFEYFGFIDLEIEQLQSKNWWIRANACREVALMKVREAIPVLTDLLDDEYEDVRIEAAQSLIDIAGVDAVYPVLTHLSHISVWMGIRLTRAILPMGIPVVGEIEHVVKTQTLPTMSFCIELLGELGDISVVPTLLAIAPGLPLEQQRICVIALGKLGDPTCLPFITDMMQHHQQEMRIAAVRAMGLLGDGNAIPLLKAIATGAPIVERIAAAEALWRNDISGRDALVELFLSNDEVARTVALEFLEEQYVKAKTTPGALYQA
ncbi:MAG: HEAT repeat domain-containing protein [Ignavibacteriales bacterium]|nr:HEAT repeat domain-containing protein [Ignavibacteriales bacterium]